MAYLPYPNSLRLETLNTNITSTILALGVSQQQKGKRQVAKTMDGKLESKGKVCVTGASGFLASWLIKRLLLSGYHVIGTVRDPGNEKKSAHLLRLEGARERLRLVKADLMEEGSFDDAIMGCHGVFHIASPVLKTSSDPKAEILDPAIQGTLNVLRSCKKNPSLRRVVLTSSSTTARARDDFDPNIPLDETSWSSVELCERRQIWYALSKTLAERAAWDFCNKNGIDLVTVLPTFVIGPSLPPDLCTTASDVLGLLKGETEKFQRLGRMGYVHIDDVALCHILVYEHEAAFGRYLCSSTVVDNNELASLLAARYPSLPIPKRFEQLNRPYYELNTSKLESLGFKFKSIQEMFDECIASLVEQEKNWISKLMAQTHLYVQTTDERLRNKGCDSILFRALSSSTCFPLSTSQPRYENQVTTRGRILNIIPSYQHEHIDRGISVMDLPCMPY